jgi:hypothetical protein
MRVSFTLTVLSAALAATLSARADEITLVNGTHLDGTLALEGSGRLRVVAADHSLIAPDRVAFVRFAPARPAPFRAGVVHQVILPGAQHLTGELLSLEAGELLLRMPGRGRLAVPRGAVVGVFNLPGRLVICDEDFEESLKAWKVTGAAKLSDRLYTSGKHGLVLDSPGQLATFALPAALPAGSLGLNCHCPEAFTGARWQLEAEFQGPSGAQVVRVVVAGEGRDFLAEAPTPRDEGAPVARTSGWHRLGMDFDATSLLVTIDDAVLWYSRGKGPAGPLREVRLACISGKGDARGAVTFDEFTLARAVDVLPRPINRTAQDDVWLAPGDELFGQVTRLDRRGLELQGRFGRRACSWGDVRGVIPSRAVATPATTAGAHVRVWLRPAAGREPDELDGVLRAFSERSLTLRHPALGDLEIERARLLRLKPLFQGQRVELDNSIRHLGEKGRTEPGLQPAQAEGPVVEYTLRLAALPLLTRLLLTVLPRGGHAEVVVNGRQVADLDAYAGRRPDAAVPVTLSLPRDALKAGDNIVGVRLRDETGRRGSCLVSEVAAELAE